LSSPFTLNYSDHRHHPAGKKYYNEQLFSEVAPKYDLVTKALSLGRDAAWKRQLVNALPEEISNPNCVDLACGTGDLCLLLAKRYPQGTVTGIDLTESMLTQARQRRVPGNVAFAQCDMCDTGIESSSVDIVTGSYALRNAPDLELALTEIERILKPGGVAAFLDFSKPTYRPMQVAEYWLLKSWGSFWGWALHGNPEIYAYIAESLALFPDRIHLRTRLSEHGLEPTASRRFFFGIVELLTTQSCGVRGEGK
jgi:demethylmenaquinone methyltransferase/2-methoxy-6-polyprenyl-1,4-benzoquinol methylase